MATTIIILIIIIIIIIIIVVSLFALRTMRLPPGSFFRTIKETASSLGMGQRSKS